MSNRIIGYVVVAFDGSEIVNVINSGSERFFSRSEAISVKNREQQSGKRHQWTIAKVVAQV